MSPSPSRHILVRKPLLPLLFLAAAPLALAHPGHGPADGITAGFAHPLSGWDHLLAMVGVGLWSAQLGGRARWLVPSAFVSVMTIGAVCGHFAGPIPGVEQAIAASVLVLGLLLGTSARLPIPACMALVGAFAAFHGLAHGAEMPATAGGLAYGAGFVAATAILHAVGVGLGSVAGRVSSNATRGAGWLIAAAGVLLFAV